MIRTLFIIILTTLLFACKKTDMQNTKDECSVEITHQLKNPYAMSTDVMFQGKATHQYVKFHISNIQQYKNLEAKGVFLLDHPFDAAPDKNLNYKTEHTATYGVYYGVVANDVNLSKFQYEKISDLYMPDNKSTSGRTEEYDGKIFKGNLTFFDPVDSVMVPLKNMQIIIKEGTKTINGFTDERGDFTIYAYNITSDTVEVLIKFDNSYLEIHTLDVANIFGVFNTNIYSLGFKKSCAFTNLNIRIGRDFNNAALHHSCAAHYSFYKYVDFANHYGFQMPSKKFLFWLGKDALISTSYATPMLHNMAEQSIANPTQLLTNLFGLPANLATTLAAVIQDQLPDLYAPFYARYTNAARASFIETMFHELSHASHYAKVGPAFWLPYVEYIYAHGGYGEAAFPNSGIIGMSEAWAEDLSNFGLFYTYGKPKYLDYNETPPADFIPYGVYHDLQDNGTNEAFDNVSNITFPQLYNLFSADLRSVAGYKAKLKAAFPAQQAAIDVLYAHYGY
jgi:hypothetical protein